MQSFVPLRLQQSQLRTTRVSHLHRREHFCYLLGHALIAFSSNATTLHISVKLHICKIAVMLRLQISSYYLSLRLTHKPSVMPQAICNKLTTHCDLRAIHANYPNLKAPREDRSWTAWTEGAAAQQLPSDVLIKILPVKPSDFRDAPKVTASQNNFFFLSRHSQNSYIYMNVRC